MKWKEESVRDLQPKVWKYNDASAIFTTIESETPLFLTVEAVAVGLTLAFEDCDLSEEDPWNSAVERISSLEGAVQRRKVFIGQRSERRSTHAFALCGSLAKVCMDVVVAVGVALTEELFRWSHVAL